MKPKHYRLTVSENQLGVISNALEEYFRLRMGQTTWFVEDIASYDVDLSPENPNHDRIYDQYIHRRDHMNEVLRCFFRIAFEPYGIPKKKNYDTMVAEDIWEAIRSHDGVRNYPA